jgi:hypothetical protein
LFGLLARGPIENWRDTTGSSFDVFRHYPDEDHAPKKSGLMQHFPQNLLSIIKWLSGLNVEPAGPDAMLCPCPLISQVKITYIVGNHFSCSYPTCITQSDSEPHQ